MNHKQLWRNTFGDNDAYLEYFFGEKAKKGIVYSRYDNRDVVSMLFAFYYDVVFRGERCQCSFITGVATDEQHRRKGYMKVLLDQSFEEAMRQKAPLAYLIPLQEEVYRNFGFQSVQYGKDLYVRGRQKKWFGTASYRRVDDETKARVAEFANSQLYAIGMELYRYRSVEYYDELAHEMKVLGGKVVVLREHGFIYGVAAYTCEEGRWEIRELLCAPEDGEKVLETVCEYILEGADEEIVVKDTYFLPNLTGEGVRYEEQTRPRIMVKSLTGESLEDLKVYINDLT